KMFNSNDNTLNELYFFIDKIKDRLSGDEINEITDIYNSLTYSIEEAETMENELIEIDEKEQLYYNHIDQTKDDIENLFDRWDDEKPIHELMDKISEIVEREVDTKEKVNNIHTLRENEVLKMVKQGYKFINGFGASIYNNYIARIEKEEQIKKQEQEMKILKEELQLKNAKVESVGIKVYSIYSNYQGVNATYDAKTGKVSGKGSRNLKDEIIKRVQFFLNYEQDLSF